MHGGVNRAVPAPVLVVAGTGVPFLYSCCPGKSQGGCYAGAGPRLGPSIGAPGGAFSAPAYPLRFCAVTENSLCPALSRGIPQDELPDRAGGSVTPPGSDSINHTGRAGRLSCTAGTPPPPTASTRILGLARGLHGAKKTRRGAITPGWASGPPSWASGPRRRDSRRQWSPFAHYAACSFTILPFSSASASPPS